MTSNFINTVTSPLQATSFVMEEMTGLTLDDVCRACSAHADIIIELVSEGVIDSTHLVSGQTPEHWRFTGLHLHRAKVALRLHRDLGVNFAGVALALELMDELQNLKAGRAATSL